MCLTCAYATVESRTAVYFYYQKCKKVVYFHLWNVVKNGRDNYVASAERSQLFSKVDKFKDFLQLTSSQIFKSRHFERFFKSIIVYLDNSFTFNGVCYQAQWSVRSLHTIKSLTTKCTTHKTLSFCSLEKQLKM